MFSIELKSRKVVVNLDLITTKDVRNLSDKASKTETGDEILGRATGLTIEEIENLPFRDYRKLIKFFWSCLANPLKDEDDAKNSQSVSTSG